MLKAETGHSGLMEFHYTKGPPPKLQDPRCRAVRSSAQALWFKAVERFRPHMFWAEHMPLIVIIVLMICVLCFYEYWKTHTQCIHARVRQVAGRQVNLKSVWFWGLRSFPLA